MAVPSTPTPSFTLIPKRLSMVAQLESPSVVVSAEPTHLPTVDGILQVITSPHRRFFANVIAQTIQLAAQGSSSLVVQFLKGGIQMGVPSPIRLCQNLTWYRCDLPRCVDTPEVDPDDLAAITDLWRFTQAQVLADRYSLVVLDELSLAISLGFIAESEVLALLAKRPRRLDMILTGPQMPTAILEQADQITELRRCL